MEPTPLPESNSARPKGRPRGGSFSGPTWNQAKKIIDRFGGEPAFARALATNRLTPYRWQYRRPYGTDGLVPAMMVDRINAAATRLGILLTSQDWLPEQNPTIEGIL